MAVKFEQGLTEEQFKGHPFMFVFWETMKGYKVFKQTIPPIPPLASRVDRLYPIKITKNLYHVVRYIGVNDDNVIRKEIQGYIAKVLPSRLPLS